VHSKTVVSLSICGMAFCWQTFVL